MNTQTRIRHICRAMILLCCAALARADDLPDVTHDGLQRVASDKVAALYVLPGATLAPYQRVQILDAYVAFRKNWKRDQSSAGIRVSSSDMEKIKQKLADEFRLVFTDELQNKGGYQVVNEAGDDVLILRPAIVDLDITAPDVMSAGRSKSFTTSAGAMTLYMEMYDGATGQLIARVADRQKAPDDMRLQWTNAVTNKQDADRILRKWAGLAHQALDRARTVGADGRQQPAAAPTTSSDTGQ